MAEIIHSGPASMPLRISYVPRSDAPQVLQLTGTASAGRANQVIGFSAKIGGAEVLTSSIESKTPNEHRVTAVNNANYTFPFVIKDGEVQPVDIEIDIIDGSEFDDTNTVSFIIV